MVAFSTKTIVTATLAMGLSAPALACVEFSGSINTDPFGGDLKSVENGVQTCSGSIQTGNKNVDCISGYSLSYDYTDGSESPHLSATYCNPSTCYAVKIALKSDSHGYTFDYPFNCH